MVKFSFKFGVKRNFLYFVSIIEYIFYVDFKSLLLFCTGVEV